MKPIQIDDDTVSFSVALLHALAHPTRLRMVELLTEGERTVSEVADALVLLQPNVSQHLAILCRAGVIKVVPQGASRCYSLRGPRIARIMELVNEFRQIHFEDLKNPPTA